MYLLDTCVISDLVSKTPDAQVVRWLDGVEEDFLHLSVITLGEIQRGIERLPTGVRKDELRTWLERDLQMRFMDRILPLDAATLLAWGALTAMLEKTGRKMPAIDSLIASQALQHGLILVTRNTADFLSAGIRMVNPWHVG